MYLVPRVRRQNSRMARLWLILRRTIFSTLAIWIDYGIRQLKYFMTTESVPVDLRASTELSVRPLPPANINTRCPYPSGTGYSQVSWRRGRYHIRSGIQHYLLCHPWFFQTWRYHRCVWPPSPERRRLIKSDKGVNFAIQKGIQISRSTVRWYEHNDMDDLERVLEEIRVEQLRSQKQLTRRFIVTEGLSENYGDVVDLPRVVSLKLSAFF